VLLFVVVTAVGNNPATRGTTMKIRLGIDIACRSPHHAACADETGKIMWSGYRFRTDVDDLKTLWERLPSDVEEVTVVMEPTRNAWVPLAAWFRRQGAVVVMVPSEQSSDLRDYFSKHTKTDRLDAELLARLPVLHPEGLHPAEYLGPGDPLKRAVKIRAGLVHRRSRAMQRLDSLLEILGPGWTDALGTRMTRTTFKFLATYANPHQVKRLGRARLARWFQHHTRKAWGPERAQTVIDAAQATLALWGNDGLDFEALAADIAAEATIALEVSEQIALLDRRIRDLYLEADPDEIVLSVPGVGGILAGQILGRLGDPHRFTNSPRQDHSPD
jgi:transposase